MPQPFNKAIMTNSGANLLLRAQAGEVTIQFTRMAIGSGIYSETEKILENLQMATNLRAEKNSYSLSNIKVDSRNSVKITALISNQDPVLLYNIVDEGYYINEIGVFAKDKESDAEEILYSIAVVAGEAGDFMPPYNGYSPVHILQDYFVTVNNAADVTIVTENAIVPVDELTEVIRSELGRMLVNNTYMIFRNIIIPTTGWTDGEDECGECLHVDIPCEDVTEEMIPIINILPADMNKAKACGMSTTCRTISGGVRFYAEKPPDAEINAEIILLTSYSGIGGTGTDIGSGSGGTSSDYILPVASKTRLGGVKIGDGVSVKPDGTISVDKEGVIDGIVATDEDVQEVFDSIFSSNDSEN